MKKHAWLIFVALFWTPLLAQQATNAPAAIATPAAAPAVTNAAPTAAAQTNAPVAKTEKKQKKATKQAAHKKDASAELRSVPLIPGPALPPIIEPGKFLA